MPISRTVYAIEVDLMIVEEIFFRQYKGLSLQLFVAISLAPEGVGRVFKHSYDIQVVRENGSKASFPIYGKETLIESTLAKGESPLIAMLESDSSVLDEVESLDSRVHAVISGMVILKGTPPATAIKPTSSGSI